MILAELRESLKKYTAAELSTLVIEIYRSIPKKQREEKHLDEMVLDINGYLQAGKSLSKEEKAVDLVKLKPEIEMFIDYAYKQYYFAPNNYVHKKNRPKWRFMVQNYIKDLQRLPTDTTEGIEATDLLDQLFRMLGYASHYYLFNTKDPFKSVGITASELSSSIFTRRMQAGSMDENIRKAVSMAVESYSNSFFGHSQTVHQLVDHLKTVDARQIALTHCASLKNKLDMAYSSSGKKSSSMSSLLEHERDDRYNRLTYLVFSLQVLLGEYKTAVNYFKSNFRTYSKEDMIIELLDMLKEFNLDDLWQQEYQAAVNKGMKVSRDKDENDMVLYIK